MSTSHQSAKICYTRSTGSVDRAVTAYYTAATAVVGYIPSADEETDRLKLLILRQQTELAKQLMLNLANDALEPAYPFTDVDVVRLMVPELTAGFYDIMLNYVDSKGNTGDCTLRVVNHTALNLNANNNSALARVVCSTRAVASQSVPA